MPAAASAAAGGLVGCRQKRDGGGRPAPPAGRSTINSPERSDGDHNPYASRSRSQTSLTVGKDGTACQRRSRETSAATAMVAEWSSSATAGPVKVAPTITRLAWSTTSWLVPATPLPRREAPDTLPVG